MATRLVTQFDDPTRRDLLVARPRGDTGGRVALAYACGLPPASG
jgi:hypothetical protein